MPEMLTQNWSEKMSRRFSLFPWVAHSFSLRPLQKFHSTKTDGVIAL